MVCAALFLLDNGQAEYEKGLAAYAAEDYTAAAANLMIAAGQDSCGKRFFGL